MATYQNLKTLGLIIVMLLSSCEGRRVIDIPIQEDEQEIFRALQATQTPIIDSIHRELYQEIYDEAEVVYVLEIHSSKNNQEITTLLDSKESRAILKKILICFRGLGTSINRFYIREYHSGTLRAYKVLSQDSIMPMQ